MQKRRKALEKDVEGLVEKYLKIMEWDIPDIDEEKARHLVLGEIRLAVDRVDAGR